MGNFMEKTKSGSTKPGKQASALTKKGNGSLDYMSKQSKFASQDASKIKRGSYKENRYE